MIVLEIGAQFRLRMQPRQPGLETCTLGCAGSLRRVWHSKHAVEQGVCVILW